MSVKEKELKRMMEDELESKSGHHTPEGLFTKSSEDIVDGLIKDAKGDEELALRRITFYINRAGDGLSNKTAVHAAKRALEKKVEEKKEGNKIKLQNSLNKYFGEAYANMFEGFVGGKENKILSREQSIDALLANGINPYWELAMPHGVLYFKDYDDLMSINGIYPSGMLEMWIWKDGKPVRNKEGKYATRSITPDEFKDALEDPKNEKVVGEFDRHWVDVDELKKIIANGDELYDAWINRFYNEYKDEYNLKSPYDSRTKNKFQLFWSGLSDYEKSHYAQGVSDPYGIATKDPGRGMPLGKIRYKASPQRLRGKVEPGTLERPNDINDPNTPYTKEYLKKSKEMDDYRIDYYPTNSANSGKTFDRIVRKMNPDGTWIEIPEEEYEKQLAHLQDIKFKPATDDQMRNKFMSDHDKIGYWLDKFNLDKKYADQSIKDPTGATWDIVKAMETHNDASPVRFQLAFTGNPEFKVVKNPKDIQDWIVQYNEKDESIEEAFGRSSKMAQPTIHDYNAVYNFLEKNGVNPIFCRGAKLYGDLGQVWRIVGYNLSDPENPLIAIQSFEKPEDGINTPGKVMSHKVPLSVVKKWTEYPENQNPSIDWDNVMLDPFQRQKARVSEPDPDRKPMKINNYDKVAVRAKHGVK